MYVPAITISAGNPGADHISTARRIVIRAVDPENVPRRGMAFDRPRIIDERPL